MKGGFIFTALLATTMLVVSGLAETPRLISYQGRLTDTSGEPLPDGAKSLRFIIWNDPAAVAPANELWNSGPVTVTTTDGLFSINLGQSPMTALDPAMFTDTLLWLGISVGADPEISPRTRLISAPYSLSALYADSARVTTDRYVNETGDTMTYGLFWALGSSAVDAYIKEGTSGGANLYLGTNGRTGAFLIGDNSGKLILRDQNGIGGAEIEASSVAGGRLHLFAPDNSTRVSISAGENGDDGGSILSLNKGEYTAVMTLDAGGSGDAAVQFPTGAISSGEMKDEAGLSSTESSTAFVFSSGSGTTYTVDSVSITIPAAGYVIVEVGGYLNAFHTNGTTTQFYVKSDKTAGTSTTSPGVHVVRIPSAWPSTSTVAAGYPIHASRLYSETSSGSKKYYLNIYYSSGESTSCNLAYRFIRATYYPTLYGTATLVANAEVGGPSVMMGDPSPAASPVTTTEVITMEEHNARVEAALAEQREALEARMKALEDRMQQIDDRRETDAGFGQ
ncbi:MAG: hypothetical protein GYA46_01125 [candidate division Zixibacteria bacterium]|nr:hypothetical protein [candidate division Zixibacteria bacterium]